MTSLPRKLGSSLDLLPAGGRVHITETRSGLVISGLSYSEGEDVLGAAESICWQAEASDTAGEVHRRGSLSEEFEPFFVKIEKPDDGTVLRIVTRAGFRQALASGDVGVWQVLCAESGFSTGTVSVNPWGHGELFAPATETKSPLDLVRDSNAQRVVPSDVRPLLVRGSIAPANWTDAAFAVFCEYSAPALVRCLATEVAADNLIVVGSSPKAKLDLDEGKLLADLKFLGFKRLQELVGWVYEDARTAEQRHALVSAEVARFSGQSVSVGRLIANSGKEILEGARLAFQLSQSDLSREAIKATGDLRKAIAEDTAKATESVRSIVGAIALTLATSIGLVAARSTGVTPSWLLALVGVVAALYLIVVVASSWWFLRIQDRLRAQWRGRFYRFIPDDDYDAMVTQPAAEAANAFLGVAVVAVVIGVALLFFSVGNLLSPLAASVNTTTPSPASVKQAPASSVTTTPPSSTMP